MKNFKIGTKYQLIENPKCIVTYMGDGMGKGVAASGEQSSKIVINDTDKWKVFEEVEPSSFTSQDDFLFNLINNTPYVVEDTKTVADKGSARVFESGASRNSEEGKLDYEGFLSPLVLEKYAEYMNGHRLLEDNTLRDSDNWQKGIPEDAYMKSMWRHFFDVWKNHRGLETPEDEITNLCAVLFNVSGMLHEKLKNEQKN